MEMQSLFLEGPRLQRVYTSASYNLAGRNFLRTVRTGILGVYDRVADKHSLAVTDEAFSLGHNQREVTFSFSLRTALEPKTLINNVAASFIAPLAEMLSPGYRLEETPGQGTFTISGKLNGHNLVLSVIAPSLADGTVALIRGNGVQIFGTVTS
jgi:hypothetical protein